MSVIGDRRSREQKAKQERWEPIYSFAWGEEKWRMKFEHVGLLDCFPSCREKELAKVTIKKEDVELIVSFTICPGLFLFLFEPRIRPWWCVFVAGQMSEMEISRAVAERSLREHLGNVVEALVALTNWLRTLLSHWTSAFTIVIFVFYSQVSPWPPFLILK